MASPATRAGKSKPRPWWPAAVVVAVAAAIGLLALGNQFTVDDLALIQNSERMHGLSHAAEILTLPYWPPPNVPDLYRPVTSLFLAFQYSLGAGDPLVFRVVSLLLYGALCVAFLRLTEDYADRRVALAAAVLFAVHPVHVEAVVNAVGQSELIVALLSIYSVREYLRLRSEPDGGSIARWARVAVAYAVASLAKEHGLIIPAFLALAEATLVRRGSWAERVREVWGGFVVLAAIGAAIVALRTAILGGVVAAPEINEALRGLSFGGRALTMLRVVPEWLRLLVWPAHLRVDYRPPEFVGSTGFGPREALGLAIVVASAAAAWLCRKRAPVCTFAIAAMAVALLPVSNLVVPSAILLAERTLLLPSVWFFLALAGASVFVRVPERSVVFQRVALGAVAVLALAGATRSVRRVLDWHDQSRLMAASVVDTPRNWRVWQGYAETLFASRQVDAAVLATNRAIDLASSKWPIRNNLAAQLHLAGRDSEAVDQLHLSLREQPRQVVALAELAPALIALGRYREARDLADSIIVVAGAPPMMVWMRQVADSAMRNNVPAGAIRIGVGSR